MIAWFNGAFGAGKTTVAEALRELAPGVRLFDPEYVGFLLRRFVEVPTGRHDPVAAPARGGRARRAARVGRREPDTIEIDCTDRGPPAVAAEIAGQLGLAGGEAGECSGG